MAELITNPEEARDALNRFLVEEFGEIGAAYSLSDVTKSSYMLKLQSPWDKLPKFMVSSKASRLCNRLSEVVHGQVAHSMSGRSFVVFETNTEQNKNTAVYKSKILARGLDAYEGKEDYDRLHTDDFGIRAVPHETFDLEEA